MLREIIVCFERVGFTRLDPNVNYYMDPDLEGYEVCAPNRQDDIDYAHWVGTFCVPSLDVNSCVDCYVNASEGSHLNGCSLLNFMWENPDRPAIESDRFKVILYDIEIKTATGHWYPVGTFYVDYRTPDWASLVNSSGQLLAGYRPVEYRDRPAIEVSFGYGYTDYVMDGDPTTSDGEPGEIVLWNEEHPVRYVDDDASEGGDGRSWSTAYRYLQDALAAAGEEYEIHVAQGVYRPDRSQATPSGSGDRYATFDLKKSMAIELYGGYAGAGAYPDHRDISAYPTVLSGDLNGNDGPVGTLENLWNDPTRADNSYHVVTARFTDDTTILDGFVIAGGNANGPSWENSGGGIENNGGNFLLANCTVRVNSAASHGAGMRNRGGGSPTIRNCLFIHNGTYIDGGAMMNQGNSCPQVAECRFEDNRAGYGGAIRNLNGSCPQIEDCAFVGNRAATWGGAILDSYSHAQAVISGSVFTSNSAQSGGGAIWNTNDSSYRLVNCVFANNRASSESGGAISNASSIDVRNCTFSGNTCGRQGGAIFNDASTATLCNTILYHNRAGTGGNQIYNKSTRSDIRYCDIESSRSGRSGQWDVLVGNDLGGNIAVDPLFVNINPGDVHLKSQAGRWNPNAQSWVVDAVTSPCIDAGDPDYPVTLEPLPNAGRINMGAYGGTAEASKSHPQP